MRKGRKSAAQTKAPVKDRIKGSIVNKKGSASSTARASSILLSDEIISALTKKVEEFNKDNKDNKVSVTTLKAVFRRGSGAFSTSHRPNMTRNGWAYARVNKFLEKKAGKAVKAAYVQDDDLMQKGGELQDNGLLKSIYPEAKQLFANNGLILTPDYAFTDGSNKSYLPYFGMQKTDEKVDKIAITYYEDAYEVVGEFIVEIKEDGKIEIELEFPNWNIDDEIEIYEKGGELGKNVQCINCGWEWNIKDSQEYDKYVCHKCGFDNSLFYSNDIMEKGGTTKSKQPAYTVVGIYKVPEGVEETEDLTKEGLLGYRIRYNKEPDRFFGYTRYNTDELEMAKKYEEQYNKEFEAEKEYKKIREAENKIKREQQKKEDEIKLQAAQQEIVKKPAYLMEDSEYQSKVVPLLKEYEKFVKKNNQYLASIDYDSFIYVTFEEALEKNLQGKALGYSFRLVGGKYEDDMSQEQKTIQSWNYKKFSNFSDKNAPKPTPAEVLEKNKDFLNKFSNYFSEDLIYKGLNKGISKSNKWNVKLSIEDDTYKKLLEDGELSESELEKIANSVDVKVPKKVFSKENVKAKETQALLQKLLKDVPTINIDKLQELIQSIKVDFKPIEEETFIKEKTRLEKYIKDLLDKEKVYETQLAYIEIWADLFNYEKKAFEEIKTGRYERGWRGAQGAEIIESKNYYIGLSLKSDWESKLDKFIKEYVDTLKYSFIGAIIKNFTRVSKPIKSFKKVYIERGAKGFEGVYRFDFEDGSHFDFKAEAISAGGYNIQKYHFRYLTNFENITLADGSKVKGYYAIVENFSSKNMAAGGKLDKTHEKLKNDLLQGSFKSHKDIEQIAEEKGVDLEYAQEQLKKGMQTESEHSDDHMVQEIIALQHLDEMIDYYEKLEYIEGKSMENGGIIVDSTEKLVESVRNEREKKIREWYKLGYKVVVARNDGYSYQKESERDSEFIDSKNPSRKKIIDIIKNNSNLKNIHFNGTIKVGNKVGEELEIADDFSVVLWENNINNEKGGQIDPDNKKTKDMITHKAGSAGGLLVGNRHSEGGIKAVNKSTNTPLEMEGGEVVITRNAVSDGEKREFEGEMLTNREILSKINEAGGGVSFEDGGKVDYSIDCNDKMAKGGETNKYKVQRTKSWDGRELITIQERLGDEKDYVNVFSINDKYSEKAKRNNYNLSKDEDVINFYKKVENGYLAEGGKTKTRKEEILEILDEAEWQLVNGRSEGYVWDYIFKSVPKSIVGREKRMEFADKLYNIVAQRTGDARISMTNGGSLKKFEPQSLVGKMLVGKIRYSEITDIKDMGNGNLWVTHESFSGFTSEENFTKDELFSMSNGKEVRGEVIRSKKSSKMADGGSLDTHSELKQFFQEQNTPVVVKEPVVEEIMEEVVVAPVEIMLFKEELTTDEDAPMIYVGSSIYANNSNGTDEWVIKSFTQDGVNLNHVPVSPLSHKHDEKHLSFDELRTLFNSKSISIKFVLNERELNLILMILKDKLQKNTSFRDGGLVFVDKEGKNDEEIMESQFGNKQF